MEYILECESVDKHGDIDVVRVDKGDRFMAFSIPAGVLKPVNKNDIVTASINVGKRRAWNLMRKLYDMEEDKRIGIFGNTFFSVIVRDYSVDEVEAKISDYENRYKIGDEVESDEGRRYCVVNISDDGSRVHCVSEDRMFWTFDTVSPSVQKTGRHFPEIEKVFEMMKGDGDE